MTELPLIVVGGLLGSAHCVGMCGGFALTLGSAAATWRANLVRQCVFGCGRVFTYSALGAAAGFGGRKLVLTATWTNAQAWLAVVAGVLLLWQGLTATGLVRLRRRPIAAKPAACLGPGLLGTLLRTRGPTAALAAGVVTGLLPCGLVYAFLALAAGSGAMERGLLVMTCFGLGTLPLLTLVGLGTSLVGLAVRQRMLQAAAWCVVLTGAVSLARGAAAFQTPLTADTPPSCPLCSPRDEAPASRIDNAAAATTMPVNVNSTTSSPTP